jgi:hypothetical protein
MLMAVVVIVPIVMYMICPHFAADIRNHTGYMFELNGRVVNSESAANLG